MNSAIKYAVIASLILALGGGAVWLANRHSTPAPAQTQVGGGFTVQGQQYHITAGSGVLTKAGSAEATTSVTYMRTSDTASSTITAYGGRAVSADFNLISTASSTASDVLYTVQFSPNGSDWYNEDCSTVTSDVLITHGAGVCTHTWTPGTTSLAYKNFTISGIQSKWFRVTLSVAAANAAVFGTVVLNEPTPN